MTDRTKFEQMLEHLINEDQERAKELFHDIVVEKSREIYESLLAEDFEDSELGEAQDDEEEVDEGMEDEVEENFGMEMEAGADHEMGGDPADDMMSDIGMDDEFGGEEGGEEEGDIEDRVVDLEDALDELKAEFEQLMAGEEGEEGHDDMGGDEGDSEFGSEEGEEEAEESYGFEDIETEDFEESLMREYVEKVASPKMGDNGANTKSIVAKPNNMGGTTANMTKGFSTEKGGTQGGLANPSTKEENFGNVNVPGGNAGKTGFKKKEPGHGAEKKGSGDNGDKSAGSLINGLKSRAK
jgi:hypothetical protein